MLRAVVDTNVLVSGLLNASGPPGAVVHDIVRQRLEPVVCAQVMAEYAAVLARRRFGFNRGEVRELLSLIGQLGTWADVAPYTGTPPLPDPADWPFVACALAAACPLITGNAKHFPARLGVQVITAREWVAQGHA
ncbi:MAG: PIN domain-containing protein [Burkholderiaceae bacterium]